MRHYQISSLLKTFLVILIFMGCGKSDKEQVDELASLFQTKQYRQLIVTYDSLSPSFKEPNEINRAHSMYKNARSIVGLSLSIVHSGDSLAQIGFVPDAYKKYTEALLLEPVESTIILKRNAIPLKGNPMYRFSGRLGAIDFVHTYHTKWVGEELLPDHVEIQVTNRDVSHPTALSYFVPSLFHKEVSKTGPHVFAVVAEPDKYLYTKLFNKLIWRDQTEIGIVTYTGARITKWNPTLSYSEMFKRIIAGSDEACFINMIGFQRVEIRNLTLIGYD